MVKAITVQEARRLAHEDAVVDRAVLAINTLIAKNWSEDEATVKVTEIQQLVAPERLPDEMIEITSRFINEGGWIVSYDNKKHPTYLTFRTTPPW